MKSFFLNHLAKLNLKSIAINIAAEIVAASFRKMKAKKLKDDSKTICLGPDCCPFRSEPENEDACSVSPNNANDYATQSTEPIADGAFQPATSSSAHMTNL